MQHRSRRGAKLPRAPLTRLSTLFAPLLLIAATAVRGAGQGPDHEHGHHHHNAAAAALALWTIEDVLALERNRPVAESSGQASGRDGRSGDGDFVFEVLTTSKGLPAKVFETSPFDGKRKRTILQCAHGGFGYDDRPGHGEVYWFLQGAGILRIGRDHTSVDLVKTNPAMLKLNMHNATFFEHHGQPMIAWPANGGGVVFVTDPDGKVLHVIGRPTVPPYTGKAGYAPTDTAYLDGKLWVTDGYGSKYVMSYDLDARKWTGTVFGGRAKKPEPGKFGTNHGITIHNGLLWIAGRMFARIHSYRPDTSFVRMFPLPEGSRPCDFEFFESGGKLFGVAASLDVAKGTAGTGASIYVVDMATLKVVSTIRPKDELGLDGFVHLHNVFPVVDGGVVTLFCQAWNNGDFAVLRQVKRERDKKAPSARRG